MRFFFGFSGARLLGLCALALLFVCGAAALFLAVPRLAAPLVLAERTFALAAAVRVCAQDALPESKAARMLLAIALPAAGAAFCFAFRTIRGAQEPPRAADGAEGIARLARLAGSPLSSVREARYFATGAAWRHPFLEDLAAAKREILLEYYIVAKGVLWSEIEKILRQRAAAGVRVKLLFDAFGSAITLPKNFVREMARAGIAAKPFRMLTPRASAARRDHRKLAVIDGETAYVGGINLADEYVGERIRFGHWKDGALRLTGGAVCGLRQMFFAAWGEDAPPLRQKTACAETHFPPPMPAIVLSDDAEGRIPRAGVRVLHELIGQAKRSLFLATPYLVPDGATMRALMRAAAGGTDVRIAIPAVPDKRTVYLLTKRNARILQAAGVQVHTYRAGFLHAKYAVADGALAMVGSWNLDFRSLYAQAECGVLVQSEALAAALEEDFCGIWKDGSPLPAAGAGEKLGAALLLPFAPLL